MSGLCFIESQGYSFDNHELNEYLRTSLDEYRELAEEEPRWKREAGGDKVDDKIVCKHRHFKSCCGDENIMKTFTDKDKSVGKACFKNISARMSDVKVERQQPDPLDLFSCAGLKTMKKKIYCINECIGKKEGLLNEDGSLNEEKIRAFLSSEGLKEQWQKDLLASGLDVCLQKDYSKTLPKEEVKADDLNCNPTYLQFLSCLNREIELGCPEQYQKNSKKCKAMRENLAEKKRRTA